MSHLMMTHKPRDNRRARAQRREQRHRESQEWRNDADVLYAAHWRREVVR